MPHDNAMPAKIVMVKDKPPPVIRIWYQLC
jgi:hypothetical protein